MHYTDFETAMQKFIERKNLIDKSNFGVMLTNWEGDISILDRFEKLPFPHRIVFVNRPYPKYPQAFYIKGFKNVRDIKNIYATQSITGHRYIDQFDYVAFINSLKEG